MKILINDIMQIANGVPDAVKSPDLSDTYDDAVSFSITFDTPVTINCIGIGYTDATEVEITDGTTTVTITIDKPAPYHNGLYLIDELTFEYEYGSEFTISHNGTFIGRVGIGTYHELGTNPTKEIGFYTTTESRKTLSGGTIPGVGGYSGRRFGADVRYKIDSDVYDDIEDAYPGQIMKSFPYFILTDDEQHKLPANMLHFYANTDGPLSMLQSSTYKFLYSYKWDFYEAF